MFKNALTSLRHKTPFLSGLVRNSHYMAATGSLALGMAHLYGIKTFLSAAAVSSAIMWYHRAGNMAFWTKDMLPAEKNDVFLTQTVHDLAHKGRLPVLPSLHLRALKPQEQLEPTKSDLRENLRKAMLKEKGIFPSIPSANAVCCRYPRIILSEHFFEVSKKIHRKKFMLFWLMKWPIFAVITRIKKIFLWLPLLRRRQR